MSKKRDYTRQERFESRQKDLGLTRVGLWIPIEDTDRVKNYVKKLRAAHVKRNLA